MNTAVILIHYGEVEITKECLKSLSKKIGGSPVYLINNTSSDISSLTKIIDNVSVIDNRENVGFAKAINQGLIQASTDNSIEAFLILNNDLKITFGNLDILTRTFIEKKSAGIVAPVLAHGGSLYDWGGKFSKWWGTVKHRNFPNRPKTTLTVDHVAGASMLIKKEVLDKVGYFDERFFLYYEDLDYCLRAVEQGYTIHINPQVVLEHQVSASSRIFSRTLRQWQSHITFVTKYLPFKVYPTAIFTDLVFYPLILLKTLIIGGK